MRFWIADRRFWIAQPGFKSHGQTPRRDSQLGAGKGDIRNCLGGLNNRGKPALRRLGILPQQLRTSLCSPGEAAQSTYPATSNKNVPFGPDSSPELPPAL